MLAWAKGSTFFFETLTNVESTGLENGVNSYPDLTLFYTEKCAVGDLGTRLRMEMTLFPVTTYLHNTA